MTYQKKPKKTVTSGTTPVSAPSFDILATPNLLIESTDNKATIPLVLIKTADFPAWVQKQTAKTQNIFTAQNWTAQIDSIACLYNDNGTLDTVFAGIASPLPLYGICSVVEKLPQQSYHLVASHLSDDELENLTTGWLLTAYRFSMFKNQRSDFPFLVWPKDMDQDRIISMARAIYMVRNLINLPPNALGPQSLADSIVMVGKLFDAETRVVEDTDLLAENFPLIYAVGDGSERRPRMAEFTWGDKDHPKVTLVGKGVCFDTGGYDLKPSAAMLTMKKDMGGAATALGVAFLIMSLNLPVRLHLIIACVENSVSGRAYRPSDILVSRKGLSVEVGNTDAEGRLVVADCLTYACEEHPDLLIDYTTLTGAARAAVGLDVQAMYTRDTELARELQDLSIEQDDPLWHMPLWASYKADIMSPIADLNNNGSNPAGSITAALFLEHFVEKDTNWIHLDHSGWEPNGKAGRPKGGAETALRSTFALIEQKFWS